MTTTHALEERRPLETAMATGLLAALLAMVASGYFFFNIHSPTGWFDDHPFPASFSWLYEFARDRLRDGWTMYSRVFVTERTQSAINYMWAETFLRFDLRDEVFFRLWSILAVGLATGLAFGLAYYLVSPPRVGARHISGSRIWRGNSAIRAARRAFRDKIRAFGRGLVIAPGVFIDRASEVQHAALIGGSGSGKSTILRWIIRWLIHRGDRAIIHDTKGDIVSSLPTEDFILVAPHDRRGLAWDVATDISTSQDARELAARFIHESHEPMWSSAGREILSGIIISLQRERPALWTWADLRSRMFMNYADLKSILEDAYPSASRMIDINSESGDPSRTTMSIMITLWANVADIVGPLASAWADAPVERRFSVRRWIYSEEKGARIVILQRSPRYPQLSAAWVGAIIGCIASTVAGPEIPDNHKRRIWLVLDEFPQLGKLEHVQELLEVGRAKGLACILAMQDIQQLVRIYGDAAAKALMSMLGLKILCRTTAESTCKELLGTRLVAWDQESISTTPGKAIGEGGSTTRNRQTQEREIPVVAQNILLKRLGAWRWGVRAILLAAGDAYELCWPMSIWPVRRPPSDPAAWTRK